MPRPRISLEYLTLPQDNTTVAKVKYMPTQYYHPTVSQYNPNSRQTVKAKVRNTLADTRRSLETIGNKAHHVVSKAITKTNRTVGSKILGDTQIDNNSYPNHKDRAIILHYPYYKGGLGSTNNIVLNAIQKEINPKFDVGHNAVITVDDAGHTKYYEYGRYPKNSSGTIGYAKEQFGNVRRLTIPDKLPQETDSAFIARIQNSLEHKDAGELQAKVINGVNADSISSYFNKLANDKNRKEYSISLLDPVTCATVVNDAVNYGRYKSNNRGVISPIRGYIRNGVSNKVGINRINPSSSGNFFSYWDNIQYKTYKFK